MSVISKTFFPTPGLRIFTAAELFNVRILGVKREGVGQTDITPALSPGSREFRQIPLGIQVSNINRFNPGEKIWILYEV